MERAKWSLRLRAAPVVSPGEYVECELELPSEVWNAHKRLALVLTGEDGRVWRNTFDALDQPEGLDVSPAFDPTPPGPSLTPAMISAMQTQGSVETVSRANVVLLELPSGAHRYAAHAELDGLTSSVVSVTIIGR